MRFIVALGLVAILVGNVAVWYGRTAHLCPTPIAYSIGSVDERFGVSAEALRDIAAEAEGLWEGAVGRDLFVYEPSSAFSINLIYDERQQLVRTEEEWRARLDTAERANEAEMAAVS